MGKGQSAQDGLLPSSSSASTTMFATRALRQAAATRPAASTYRRSAAAAASPSSSASPTSARSATSPRSAAAAAAPATPRASTAPSATPQDAYDDPFAAAAEDELSRVAPLAPPPSASASSGPPPPPARPIAGSSRRVASHAVDRSPLAEFGKPPFPPSYADQLASATAAIGADESAAGPSGIDWTTAWNGLGAAVISREQAQQLMRPLQAEEIQIKPGASLF